MLCFWSLIWRCGIPFWILGITGSMRFRATPTQMLFLFWWAIRPTLTDRSPRRKYNNLYKTKICCITRPLPRAAWMWGRCSLELRLSSRKKHRFQELINGHREGHLWRRRCRSSRAIIGAIIVTVDRDDIHAMDQSYTSRVSIISKIFFANCWKDLFLNIVKQWEEHPKRKLCLRRWWANWHSCLISRFLCV